MDGHADTFVSALASKVSIAHFAREVKRAGRMKRMTLIQRRLLILLIVVVAGAVLGRLTLRAILNFLVGGTMFGGNFL